MKHFFLKHIKPRLFAICWLLSVLVLSAFQNAGESVAQPQYNYWFLAAGAVGMIAHFVKKYLETKNSGTPITFITWYIQNAGWSIASAGLGLTALYGGFIGMQLNPQTLFLAFNTGFAADSLNQGGKTTPADVPPPAKP